MKKKGLKDIRAFLLDWYEDHQRQLPWRKTNDPYKIWVSEVMLQQTQVKTVIPYYNGFIERFPDIDHLARAGSQSVLKQWEGLGYYGRARNLHRAARIIVDAFNGVIPDNWKDIRKLPGVGDYIASAVLSIAFDLPYAVVDGNVKRVLARMYKIGAPVNRTGSNKIFKRTAAGFLDAENPGMFNQAVMELGALVCTPYNPMCASCPIQALCRAYQSCTVHVYPKRLKSKPIPTYHLAVGVVLKEGKLLITQRRNEGLLGGLWEFPGGKIQKNDQSSLSCIREIKATLNLSVKIKTFIAQVNHAYTHFKIVVDVFLCQFVGGNIKLNGPADYRWITLSEIADFPLPQVNHKFLPKLKTILDTIEQS